MGWGLSCRSVLRMSDEQPPVPEADFLRSLGCFGFLSPKGSQGFQEPSELGPRELPRSLHVACAAVPEPRAGRLAAGTGSAAPGTMCWKLLIWQLSLGFFWANPDLWTNSPLLLVSMSSLFIPCRRVAKVVLGLGGFGLPHDYPPAATARAVLEVNVLLMLHRVPQTYLNPKP